MNVAELREALEGTEAEVIEVEFPVNFVSKTEFKALTTDDIAEMEATAPLGEFGDAETDHLMYASTLKTYRFVDHNDIRSKLGGKKLFVKSWPDHEDMLVVRFDEWVPVNERFAMLEC